MSTGSGEDEMPVVQAGDEPDRPYELAIPKPVGRARRAARQPVETISAPQPASPAPVETGFRDELFAEPTARALYIPLALLIGGVVCTLATSVLLSKTSHDAAAAVGYALAGMALRVPLMLATCLTAARVADVAFGRAGPAVLKMCAIAVAPGAAAGLLLLAAARSGIPTDGGVTDLFSGGLVGGVLASALALAVYFALFYTLFDLPVDLETWAFLGAVWVVQTFFAAVLLHLVFNPPAVEPPYVPDPNHHFVIGN